MVAKKAKRKTKKAKKKVKKTKKKVQKQVHKPKISNNDTKKSELGLTVKKEKNFSEWYTQTIQKAELIEYSPVSGCMVIRPYAYSIWEAVQDFMDKEIKKMGIQNA